MSTVLITGGSRGIGLACVKKFLTEDATVIATYQSNNGELLNLQEMFPRLHVVKFSQAENTSRQELFKYLTDNNLVPTILVNNAGINKDNLLMISSEQAILDVVNVNILGMTFLTKDFVKMLRKNKKEGNIVNLSSVVGFTGNVGQTIYSMTKSALIGFTKSLAKEMGSLGVRVNAVAPGFIETDMTEKLTLEQKTKLLEQVPMKRMGTSEEVAECVFFLSSFRASYITGEIIHINGGMY